MADNFLYEVREYGKVLNANRTYYLSRSQPPFLTRMILAIYERTHDAKWLAESVPALERYYRYWTSEPHLTPETGLSRYYDLGEGPAPEVISSELDRRGRTDYDLIRKYFRSHRVTDYDDTQYYDAAHDRLTALFYKGDRSMRESGFDPSNRWTSDISHNKVIFMLYWFGYDTAKKRTIMENLKRNAAKGDPTFKDIKSEDLRFKVWEPTIKYQSNAVVIAMMDISGSMGEFEKYIARSFYFWMVRFLRTKYNNVHIVFISHHTEAKEVTEEEFFHKGESGGTQVSSAYELALQIIQERYNPNDWNIYPFHFSDGDNLPWDNDRCVQLVHKLMNMCNIFGYGEIREGHYRSPSTLMSAYNKITDKKFTAVTISDKKEVYPALRKFFAQRDTVPVR